VANRKGSSKPSGRNPKNPEPSEDDYEDDDVPAAPPKAKAKKKSGPSRSRVGRYTSPTESGRYTPPVPKTARSSPVWYGILVLALLIGGLLLILLNYLEVLPWSQTSWYLVLGLGVIFVGFILATRYR
jgi:hypothetical protein